MGGVEPAPTASWGPYTCETKGWEQGRGAVWSFTQTPERFLTAEVRVTHTDMACGTSQHMEGTAECGHARCGCNVQLDSRSAQKPRQAL
uniref:Uncharacterized protein n=1 Tax=Knipowitschia caucasica TaxID=637954 RepID=A0AAV2JD06_KNICA